MKEGSKRDLKQNPRSLGQTGNKAWLLRFEWILTRESTHFPAVKFAIFRFHHIVFQQLAFLTNARIPYSLPRGRETVNHSDPHHTLEPEKPVRNPD